MALKIADMSQFNTVTNWDDLAKSVDGIVLRMGYRGSHTGEITYDPKFVEYIYKIKEHKIPYSVYFFPCSISDTEADEEADFIIETIKNYDLKLALPVYLDSEVVQQDRSGRSDKLSPARRTQYLNRIMKKLQDKNIPYGVYASTSWYNNQLNDKDLLAGCSRWVAQYNSECTYNNYPYDLWQYTSKGSIKGVSGNIDLSHCYVELDLVENKEELEPQTPPQTPTEPIKPVEPKKVKITEADCINKLITIAKEEVGYLEKRNGNLDYLYTKTQNAGSANYTKYGYELHQLQPKNMDYPAYWCDAFVDWVVLQVVNRLNHTMAEAKKVLCGDFDDYTVYSANHYKKKGRWYTSNPKVGDQIFFKNSSGICHTGIVYKVDSSKVYTIEGNTSGASGVVSNGGGVAMKSYARNYSGIAGYGRMDWSCIVGKEIIVDNNTTANTNNNTNNKVTSIKATSKSEFAISKTGSPNKNKVFIGKVTASSLNVRSWAGTNNKTISFSPLKKGIEVIVCDAILAKDGSNWYYIKYNGKYGFVSSAYIAYVRA